MKKEFQQFPIVMAFSQVPDPRVRNRCKYELIEIIVVSICGVLCGCETWIEIEEFSHERREFFEKFLALKNGLPSHDTLARCFSLLDPEVFQSAFVEWVTKIKGVKAKSIAIDGKAVSGTHRGFNDGTYPLYTLNVWCHESGLAISQKRASGPGHGEIFAAEECLNSLMLEGTLVTMDAGLAVKRVTDKIRERRGHYLIPIKKNQRHSLKVVDKMFKNKKQKIDIAESSEKSRGRTEKRVTSVMRISCEDHPNLENWQDLASAIKIYRERTDHKTGELKEQTYYYISSRKLTARQALREIRGHWEIENKLHWSLDVTFLEDSWKVRQRIAAENLTLVRKICFNLLQKSPGKGSKRLKMKKASWNPDYLEEVLFT